MAVRKSLGQMGSAHMISFALNFASVIVVSRLLTPTEIGIYSVSVAVLGIAHIFRDFGVGQYLVQVKNAGKREIRAAFSVTLYTSWLIAAVLYFSRVPLAHLYDHEGIAEVLVILSVNFLVLPFGTPLLALMQRDLQFKFLAYNMVMATVVQTVVTVVCAYYGQSYLSMAWGALAAAVLKVVWLNMMRPGTIFMLPTFRGLGEAFRFGSITSAASIIREIGASAPDLILGRTLGFADVAIYSRANGLIKMFIFRLLSLVQGVYFPTFANEIRNGADGSVLYSKAMKYMVAITAPILAFLAVISEPLILFLFGEQWHRSAFLASMLCIYGVLGTPYHMVSISLVAAGKVELNLRLETINQTCRILLFMSSIFLSLEELILLMCLSPIIHIATYQAALHKTFDLRFFTHIKQVLPSLLLALYTVVGPVVVLWYMQPQMESGKYFVVLVLSTMTAAMGWLIGVYVGNHELKKEIRNGYQFFIENLSVRLRKS